MQQNYEKEKREAIDAGNRALWSLQEARNQLDKANGWGLVDMLGGGLFTTFAKRSRMDRAKEFMNRARYDLQTFSRELRDISMTCHLDIKTDGFLSFADYFFDNIFVDWMVQDRIQEAARQVDTAIYRVQEVLDQLSRR